MNGHDTDPTPPHGTERPPTPTHDLDLRGKYENTLGKVHAFTDHDRAVLLTVTDALDALALAVWAFHHGDGDTLRDVLTASGRDWFGWFRCPSCHAESDPDDRGESGYCLACDAGLDYLTEPCAGCGETGRTLNEESTCADCLGLYPEEMGETEPCEFGHFDCATEEGGRCSNLRAALDRVEEIIEANADRLSAVLDD